MKAKGDKLRDLLIKNIIFNKAKINILINIHQMHMANKTIKILIKIFIINLKTLKTIILIIINNILLTKIIKAVLSIVKGRKN
jgi:hypothetical protein